MKKSLVLSLVSCSLMYGYVNPLPTTSKAIDNGGSLSAIDAYQDGVGAMILEKGRGIDNSSMNTLVFKYGNIAKDNGIIIGDQVLLTGTAEDKLLAGKLFADGVSCNDNNSLSTGESYLNGICQGGSIPNGTNCNDNNIMTVNDIYTNQICGGTLTINGTSCDDNNALTYADKWLNGVCSGFTNGTSCNDNNPLTYTDIYNNGICSGVTNGTVCNDNNINTINDVYTSGICAGVMPKSCKEIKTAVSSSTNGIYTIDPDGTGSIASLSVYCDMTTDGGGWTLIGKGREGWSWTNSGRGSSTTISNSPNTIDVAYLPSTTVNAILGKALNASTDGLRISRESLSQEYRWRFSALTSFVWTFDASYAVSVTLNGTNYGGFNTQDQYVTGPNDCTRIFTWAWDGHGYVTGFSSGSSCPIGYGWVAGGEGHPIPMTKVWVRN